MCSPTKDVLHQDDLDCVVQRYTDRIRQHGLSLESLNSGGIEKQHLRYGIHFSAIQGPCPRVLDIGCGLGGMYAYLKERHVNCTFVGYDVVPAYVEACRTSYPEARFECRNIFEEGIDGTFDTVVMSQVLNNLYRRSNNVDVMQTAIRMAYERTKMAVSVDMMSSYAEQQREGLHYYEPEQVFRFARTLAKRVVLRHDYRSAEFAIQLFHPEASGYIP